jgi:hypothetical protein
VGNAPRDGAGAKVCAIGCDQRLSSPSAPPDDCSILAAIPKAFHLAACSFHRLLLLVVRLPRFAWRVGLRAKSAIFSSLISGSSGDASPARFRPKAAPKYLRCFSLIAGIYSSSIP